MTSELDSYFPRPKVEPDVHAALDALDAQDFEPQGVVYKDWQEALAASLLKLMGVEYRVAGARLRKDAKGAAKWILQNARGDYDGAVDVLSDMAKDERERSVCGASKSPYVVARRVYTELAKRHSAAVAEPVDYTTYTQTDEPDYERGNKYRSYLNND